jgi:hypothetical protein
VAARRWPRAQASLGRKIDLDASAAEGRAIARDVNAELPGWSLVYFDDAEAARYQGPPFQPSPGRLRSPPFRIARN